jgi:tRNA threonylcarbamoyladenosine biosynthesis protein TsaB
MLFASPIRHSPFAVRSLMFVLALDTALGACAACVLDVAAGRVLAQQSLPMERGHAEALMPLVSAVMAESGIGFSQLDRICATTGPGSFTGLRVGLSAARGIALATRKPAIGIGTLTAFAAPEISEGGVYPVISAVDARHGHVYYQVVSGSGAALVRPKIAPIAQVYEAARFGLPVIVGNGAHLVAKDWPVAVPPAKVVTTVAPAIDWVAWVGAAVDPLDAPARPTYLKAPDAKLPTASALPRVEPFA